LVGLSFAGSGKGKAPNGRSPVSVENRELNRGSLKPAAGKGRLEALGLHLALNTPIAHGGKQNTAPLAQDVKPGQLEEAPRDAISGTLTGRII
jgi:hypothetical protein